MSFYKDSDDEDIEINDHIQFRFTNASKNSQVQKIKYFDESYAEIDRITQMQDKMILPEIYNSILEKRDDLPKRLNDLKRFTYRKNYKLPEDFSSPKFINSLVFLINPENDIDEEITETAFICLINIFYDSSNIDSLFSDDLLSFIFDMLSQNITGVWLIYLLTLVLNTIDETTVQYFINKDLKSSLYSILEAFLQMDDEEDRHILRLTLKCIKSLTTYNDEPEFIDSFLDFSTLMANKIACQESDIHKEIITILFNWMKKSDQILDNIVKHPNFVIIPHLCERPSMECFSTYFKIYSLFLHKKIEFDKLIIYNSLKNWELLQKYDELAKSSPSITDFMMADMDNDVEGFESYLPILIDRFDNFKPIEKDCFSILLLKYISVLPLIKSEEKAKEYFPMIFEIVPFVEYDYLKQSIIFLQNLIQKNEDFIIIALDSDIDSTLFENLEREFPDINEMIDQLYDDIHRNYE